MLIAACLIADICILIAVLKARANLKRFKWEMKQNDNLLDFEKQVLAALSGNQQSTSCTTEPFREGD